MFYSVPEYYYSAPERNFLYLNSLLLMKYKYSPPHPGQSAVTLHVLTLQSLIKMYSLTIKKTLRKTYTHVCTQVPTVKKWSKPCSIRYIIFQEKKNIFVEHN